MSEALAKKLIEDLGGKVEEVGGPLPDGSGFMIGSFPLPKDHWLYTDPEFNVPPMPFLMGKEHPERKRMEEALRAAGRYAVRCATMNGKDGDFDPDALIQNLVVGMVGYHTATGLSCDSFANPPERMINGNNKGG